MTQSHQTSASETSASETRYDFDFQTQLTPEQALLHLGLQPSSTTPSWIRIETSLTEQEALQAYRKLWPENAGNADEMVRHHLKTDRMNVSSLTDEALPALAQEQSERTGREYRPRNEKDIPLETFVHLLELAEDAWWVSRERYCRLEYNSIQEANIDINLLLISDQES